MKYVPVWAEHVAQKVARGGGGVKVSLSKTPALTTGRSPLRGGRRPSVCECLHERGECWAILYSLYKCSPFIKHQDVVLRPGRVSQYCESTCLRLFFPLDFD